MSQNEDIRWKQRLFNFNKDMQHLETALRIEKPDMVQKAGIFQFFEMSFELGWILLKDYLEQQGFEDVKTPRSALKKAFETGLIAQGHEWPTATSARIRTTNRKLPKWSNSSIINTSRC